MELLFFSTYIPGGLTCINCNKPVQKAIFNSAFYPNLLTMLSAFLMLGIMVTLLVYLVKKREMDRGTKLSLTPLISTSVILGIGLGGFIDGIVLHQILQWHEMLSNKIPPDNLVNKSVNMFWDGIFHAFTLLVTLIGIFSLFSLFSRNNVIISKRVFIGGLFLGWGLFNIVEGVIDHHILKLHNVREITANTDAWNYGFLIVSGLMILGAVGLIKKGIPQTD